MRMVIDWQQDMALEDDVLSRIIEIVRQDGLFVYPTQNLYGLGTGITSGAAIEKLAAAKKRPRGMPLSIMGTREQIGELCSLDEKARKFFESGFTSITAVLKASGKAPSGIIHKGTIAARLPSSELARSIVEKVGPITATSANLHGSAPPVTVEEAETQLRDSVSLYINGGRLTGTPTTLVDLTSGKPIILRKGLMTEAQVLDIYER